MFGKPEWFREQKCGWGLIPITWQGRAHAGAWISVSLLPFLALCARHQFVEGFIWLAAAMGTLLWDVRSIISAMHPQTEDVLYIDENETVSEQFATRNYDFRVRR